MTEQAPERRRKAETIEIDFWYDSSTDAIHVTSAALSEFHVAINDKPGSRMGHPQLHRRLRTLLEAADKWPVGQ